jgi:hypothetical protein
VGRLRSNFWYVECCEFIRNTEVEMTDDNQNGFKECQRKIIMKDRGRFFSLHAGGLVYHDSKHRIYKVRVEGGFIFELVQELQPDGTFQSQLLTTRGPSGETSIIEYKSHSKN